MNVQKFILDARHEATADAWPPSGPNLAFTSPVTHDAAQSPLPCAAFGQHTSHRNSSQPTDGNSGERPDCVTSQLISDVTNQLISDVTHQLVSDVTHQLGRDVTHQLVSDATQNQLIGEVSAGRPEVKWPPPSPAHGCTEASPPGPRDIVFYSLPKTTNNQMRILQDSRKHCSFHTFRGQTPNNNRERPPAEGPVRPRDRGHLNIVEDSGLSANLSSIPSYSPTFGMSPAWSLDYSKYGKENFSFRIKKL